MISYMLHDVSALFKGNATVKIWKGAYLLERSFH